MRNRPALWAAAVAVPAALAAAAPAAAAPVLATDAVCLRPLQRPNGGVFGPLLNLEGAGFTPNATVTIARGARPFTTVVEPTGVFSAQLFTDDLLMGTAPRSRRIRIVATDPALGDSNALTVRLAPLAFSASPARAKPSAQVTFRFSGFAAGVPVYAHYRYGGRLRATVRMGVAGAPCGLLTSRRRQIPVRDPENGVWRIQFSQRKQFRPRTTRRIDATLRVGPR